MDINPVTVVTTIVNFIIILLVATYYLFKPVTNIIATRQNEISDSIKKAKEDQEQATLLKIERQDELKGAKKEGKKIVEEFKVKAEVVKADIEKEANEEAHLILERARKEIEREEQKAKYEIKNQAVDLALLLSSKALEEAIDEEKHRRLIEDFIAKVGM